MLGEQLLLQQADFPTKVDKYLARLFLACAARVVRIDFGKANFISLVDDHGVRFHVIESTKDAGRCGPPEEFGYLTSTGMVLSLR